MFKALVSLLTRRKPEATPEDELNLAFDQYLADLERTLRESQKDRALAVDDEDDTANFEFEQEELND